MVAAETVEKNDRSAGADALVVERELADFQFTRRNSIFHRDTPCDLSCSCTTRVLICRCGGLTAVARRSRRLRGGRSLVGTRCGLEAGGADQSPLRDVRALRAFDHPR